MTGNSSHREETAKPPSTIRERLLTISGLVVLLIGIVLAFVASGWMNNWTKPITWDVIHQAQQQGDFEEAIRLCVQLAERDPDQAAEAFAAASEVAIEPLAEFTRGEELALTALDLAPGNKRALASYTRLLTMTGRRWKSIPLLTQYVTQFDDSVQQLIWLADTSVVITDWDLLQKARSTMPTDPLPSLGLAFDALVSRPDEAIQHLKNCLKANPDLMEARAFLGRAFLENGDEKAFQRWNSQLPATCEVHPEVWRARGLWWRSRDHRKALRCYLECCRRIPDDAQTNLQVSLLLTQADEQQAAATFKRRFETMTRYLDLVRAVRELGDLSVAPEAADCCIELQRPAEAAAWYRIAIANGYAPPVADLASRIPDNKSGPLRASLFDLDEVVDVTRWPIPHAVDSSTEPAPVSSLSFSNLRFRNIAPAIGLDFQYVNGASLSEPPVSLHKVNGGGVAGLDYDSDGWTDLFLTQAGGTPGTISKSGANRDPLFRNIDGVRVQEVSEVAGIFDLSYGQGCTAGDFDNDGFTDILIANIGQNRLLKNCGDGTFQDVTAESGISGEAWTSSCAFADFNCDSWPDVYEVRYVDTEELFEKQCHFADGVRRPCPPKEFPAVDDVLWLSKGNGKFEALSKAELPVTAGRGLSVIIADFDQQSGLDVFVGNDGTADFLLMNQSDGSESRPQFQNEATVRGVAVHGNGSMQATMGIAFGDVNRDGDPEVFQTNFHSEPNTLYESLGNGYFNDATAYSRLHTPSLQMLGWGTELIDADLDGWLDLVVVNGHLEDKTRLGHLYQMPAQLFRNDRHGKFTEVAPENVGAWFGEPRLSRSLATLDWNRDGQLDFAVAGLDSPAAVLAGDTSPVGNYLTIHLRAVDSARDAIGTRVEFQLDNTQHVYELTAGDGYQTSNQRVIHMGLGSIEVIDHLKVEWPSGRVQEWNSVGCNQEVAIVESREILTIPRN